MPSPLRREQASQSKPKGNKVAKTGYRDGLATETLEKLHRLQLSSVLYQMETPSA